MDLVETCNCEPTRAACCIATSAKASEHCCSKRSSWTLAFVTRTEYAQMCVPQVCGEVTHYAIYLSSWNGTMLQAGSMVATDESVPLHLATHRTRVWIAKVSAGTSSQSQLGVGWHEQ
eukprot:5861890-Amphidinium_carterae.1